MYKLVIALSAALALAGAAQAQVTVSDAWIRATVPQQRSAGAFMRLRSATDTRLMAVSSPLAKVEIHQMQMQGERMTMRPAESIALAAGQTVNLASGGYHLMLSGLTRQLKEGEQVPLALTFEDAHKRRSTVALKVVVKPLTFSAAGAHN